MWRMRRGDGHRSHTIIRLSRDGAVVIWFINDRPMGCRVFRDVTSAIQLSDQMQAQNWATGWRLVSEESESPNRS